MFKSRNLVVLMIFGLFLLLLTGCSGKASTGAAKQTEVKDTVKFAYISMIQGSPQALINREAGIFEEQLQKLGKKTEFVATRSLDNIWPMMDDDKDDPDFVYIPTANFSTYVTETSRFGGSNKYAIIAGSNNADSTALFVSPEIKSLKDLDGKTVGIANLRYQDEFQLNKVLNTVGLSTTSAGGTVKIAWDDIVIKEIENFSSGKYEAIVLYDPENFSTVLKKVPGSKMLTTLNPNAMFGNRQPRTWLVAKKELIKNNPELVKTVLKAHVLATEKALAEADKIPLIAREVYLNYYKEKNVEMTEIMKKHTPEFYRKKWSETEITYDPNMKFVVDDFGFMNQKGLVKGKTIEDFVQIEPLNEVLKEMGKPLIPLGLN